MKKQILSSFVLLAALTFANFVEAQVAKTPRKVIRLKLIEDKDGVKHEIDTVLNNPTQEEIDKLMQKYGSMEGSKFKDTKMILDATHMDEMIAKAKKEGATVIYKDVLNDGELPDEAKRIMDSLGVNQDCKKGAKMIVIDMNEEKVDRKGAVEEHKILVVRKIVLSDLNKEELINKQKLGTNNNLKVEQLNLYPNPNNGLVKLHFTLTEKGNTVVLILNKNGNTVYIENLKDFEGTYEKEINLSGQEKGVYFLNVEQGAKSLNKKIIIE